MAARVARAAQPEAVALKRMLQGDHLRVPFGDPSKVGFRKRSLTGIRRLKEAGSCSQGTAKVIFKKRCGGLGFGGLGHRVYRV